MAKKRYYSSAGAETEMYERAGRSGVATRSRNGGSMIATDYSAPALCPRNVIDRYWPDADYQMSAEGIKDLYTGVMGETAKDVKMFKKILKPSHY